MTAAVVAARGRLLKGSQAAVRLGIGYDAVLRLIAAKQIAHVRNDNGRLLGIYENDCDAWIEAHRIREQRGHEPSGLRTNTVDAEVAALLGPGERLW
jgi:excisionase family DNA binding protein